MSDYNKKFIDLILSDSSSDDWQVAKYEWSIIDYKIDMNCSSECLCGKNGIKFLYKIKNENNGKEISPIGSSCIKKFERSEFNDNISLHESFLKIVEAVERKEFLELKNGMFNKKLLKFFYDKNLFKPNKYNKFNPSNDYEFLIKMFNKKNPMTDKEKAKTRGLIGYTIVPFLQAEIESKVINKEVIK